MKDRYQIDLRKYSIQKFFNGLKKREMIPSRKNLKDQMDYRLKVLEENRITNLKELTDILNKKDKIDSFSMASGLNVEYLTLLNREVKSFLTKPINLEKLIDLNPEYLVRLKNLGIKNTKHMLSHANTRENRIQLSKKTDIPIENLYEIVCLSDLLRAYGVGPVFAGMIYNLGIQTINDFINTTAEEFIEIYEEKTQKKADFGINDIQFSLDLARELEQIVEL